MNEPATSMATPTPEAQQPPPPPAATAVGVSDSRRKSTFLACVLSAMPGLGQVYVGYYRRGFIHIVVAASAITLLAEGSLGPLIPLVGFFLAFFWLYNIVDAGRRAALYNYALDGGTAMDLPDDFQVPGFRGSLVGGVTLVIVGLILLANTRFGVSLDWIEEWWPLAIVGFGGYLAYKALQEKSDDG
ncbi:MAG: hypothetical protein ACE5GX_09245 [Thermoanaerobaculia bacterium]